MIMIMIIIFIIMMIIIIIIILIIIQFLIWSLTVRPPSGSLSPIEVSHPGSWELKFSILSSQWWWFIIGTDHCWNKKTNRRWKNAQIRFEKFQKQFHKTDPANIINIGQNQKEYKSYDETARFNDNFYLVMSQTTTDWKDEGTNGLILLGVQWKARARVNQETVARPPPTPFNSFPTHLYFW